MSPEFKPWEKYPALKVSRLSRIADLFREVREECVRLHEPHKGDGPWSLGCRVYERSFFEIKELAKKEQSWLGINQEFHHLAFSFNIGPVPLRFYRGDPEGPPSRYLEYSAGEQIHLQRCIQFDDRPTVDSILRLAVRVDSTTRQTYEVILIEISEEREIVGHYSIPFGASRGVSIETYQATPIDIPAVKAEPINTDAEEGKKEEKSNAGAK
jgi:hypothetical protein